jgi:uncharacterized membrane protein HdeD (DUF308 family)
MHFVLPAIGIFMIVGAIFKLLYEIKRLRKESKTSNILEIVFGLVTVPTLGTLSFFALFFGVLLLIYGLRV